MTPLRAHRLFQTLLLTAAIAAGCTRAGAPDDTGSSTGQDDSGSGDDSGASSDSGTDDTGDESTDTGLGATAWTFCADGGTPCLDMRYLADGGIGYGPGDVDADGLADVVVGAKIVRGVADYTSDVSVAAAETPLQDEAWSYSYRYRGFRGGDVDCDGHADLVIGDGWDEVSVRVWRGPFPAEWHWDDSTRVPLPTLGRTTVRVAPDLTGDGCADVLADVALSDAYDTVRHEVWLLESPVASSTPPPSSESMILQTDDGPSLLVYGDLDGDGLTDIGLGGCVYLAPVSSAVEAVPVFCGSTSEFMGVGDVDGDGMDDFAEVERVDHTNDKLHLQDLPGFLAGATPNATLDIPEGEPLSSVGGIGDVDGDGRAEVGISLSFRFSDSVTPPPSSWLYFYIGALEGHVPAERAIEVHVDGIHPGVPPAWDDEYMRGGSYFGVGDFDGNGYGDVVLSDGNLESGYFDVRTYLLSYRP